jgi:hypothetical protein
MAYEQPRFQIIPDPKDPRKWAWRDLKDGLVYGGYVGPEAASKAAKKWTKP